MDAVAERELDFALHRTFKMLLEAQFAFQAKGIRPTLEPTLREIANAEKLLDTTLEKFG